jgi:hypothetical protein
MLVPLSRTALIQINTSRDIAVGRNISVVRRPVSSKSSTAGISKGNLNFDARWEQTTATGLRYPILPGVRLTKPATLPRLAAGLLPDGMALSPTTRS